MGSKFLLTKHLFYVEVYLTESDFSVKPAARLQGNRDGLAEHLSPSFYFLFSE